MSGRLVFNITVIMTFLFFGFRSVDRFIETFLGFFVLRANICILEGRIVTCPSKYIDCLTFIKVLSRSFECTI